MKTVAVSGGFDPIHIGHIDLMVEASRLGRLIVLLNSDRFLIEKKGYVFMPFEQRKRIIGFLRMVDEVVPCIDEGMTVCRTLEKVRPDVFANGGDRTRESIPEIEICERLGIEMVFGVGGRKVESSSAIVRKSIVGSGMVEKPWGSYEVLYTGDGHKVKRLVVQPGHQFSLQYHKERREYWVVVQGAAIITYGDKVFFLNCGGTLRIEREMRHRVRNIGSCDLVMIEVQLGRCTEEDVVRVEDDYGR